MPEVEEKKNMLIMSIASDKGALKKMEDKIWICWCHICLKPTSHKGGSCTEH